MFGRVLEPGGWGGGLPSRVAARTSEQLDRGLEDVAHRALEGLVVVRRQVLQADAQGGNGARLVLGSWAIPCGTRLGKMER